MPSLRPKKFPSRAWYFPPIGLRHRNLGLPRQKYLAELAVHSFHHSLLRLPGRPDKIVGKLLHPRANHRPARRLQYPESLRNHCPIVLENGRGPASVIFVEAGDALGVLIGQQNKNVGTALGLSVHLVGPG